MPTARQNPEEVIDSPIIQDGNDTFVYGMDSFMHPGKLDNGFYSIAMNVMNRGGIIQTRPGSKSLFDLPSGRIQGVKFFKPGNGIPHILCAIDGKIYASRLPFKAFTRIPNIQFSKNAKFVSWAVCIQSTTYDESGVLKNLTRPKPVLIMQDGATRAAYWDGSKSGHLNPGKSALSPIWTTAALIKDNGTLSGSWLTPQRVDLGGVTSPTPTAGTAVKVIYIRSDSAPATPTAASPDGWSIDQPPIVTKEGYDETPIGLWSAWSNNRLWISNGERIMASDIGNPLKFTESQYLNEARAFFLPSPCTGMAETPDKSGIIAFTEEQGFFFQSSIQDRTKWLSTPDFQRLFLPNIGCVSPRSIVQQYGLLYWFTPRGLMNQNNALSTNITSRMDIQDVPMSQSKANLNYDLSGVAGISFENFMLHAVPNGGSKNNRIHVLDQAPLEDSSRDAVFGSRDSWASYWTGWNPVELTKGVADGQERIFCISNDNDGVNRVWELFLPRKTDNGIPITCFFASRSHYFGNRDWKKFRYAELEMTNIVDDVSLMVAVSAVRGGFQTVLTKEISSTLGQIYHDSQYGYGKNGILGTASQTRVVRTTESMASSACNDKNVESDKSGLYDKAFQLLVVWSGAAGFNAYRIFAQMEPEAFQGVCESNETGEDRTLNEDGCGELLKFSEGTPFEVYTATATFSMIDPSTGDTVSRSSSQSSIISQEDAKRKAELTAQWYVENAIGS